MTMTTLRKACLRKKRTRTESRAAEISRCEVSMAQSCERLRVVGTPGTPVSWRRGRRSRERRRRTCLGKELLVLGVEVGEEIGNGTVVEMAG